MITRVLTASDFEAVHYAFVQAFSDYVVKMSPTRSQLEEMFRRRGYVPEASAGVFEGDQLAAFALNCLEGPRAYNTGTGVVPSHRRLGLGKEVMEFSYSLLRARGCTTYVLEVLEQNQAAIGLYRAGGFVERRTFQCWSLEPAAADEIKATVHPGKEDWSLWERWWSVRPAWQNSSASLQRAHDHRVVLGNSDGYAIIFPSTGDLPQLAVRPEARRHGLGTTLLHQTAGIAKKPLRILLLDGRDTGIAEFLEHAGARRTVRAIEMERAL